MIHIVKYKMNPRRFFSMGVHAAFLICLLGISKASAQVENLIVETYYIADANDATDTTQGRSLEAGMKTFRVYLDLAPGTRIRKIFGNNLHPLRISSTEVFYNNIDRPNANFGYLVNKSWFDDNPTIALDSWITLGLGTTQYLGIPKDDDTDGTLTEISNNLGGTAAIPGGILMNSNPLAGIPLSIADGYMLNNTNTTGQWLDFGFRDLSNTDTTVFGPVNTGNEFLSYNAELQQNNGVRGADTVANKVLVAQLTTAGELSFELNVELEEFDGNNYNIVTYVANGDSISGSEVVSPFLKFPPACGCTDPDYLEYSSAFACSLADSCITRIVFGCTDTLACNYDPLANYNLAALCCYPGYCYDRDLAVVCPELNAARFSINALQPSPATHELNFTCSHVLDTETLCFIYDTSGKLILEKNLVGVSDRSVIKLNIESMDSGLYFLIVKNGNETDSRAFMKVSDDN